MGASSLVFFLWRLPLYFFVRNCVLWNWSCEATEKWKSKVIPTWRNKLKKNLIHAKLSLKLSLKHDCSYEVDIKLVLHWSYIQWPSHCVSLLFLPSSCSSRFNNLLILIALCINQSAYALQRTFIDSKYSLVSFKVINRPSIDTQYFYVHVNNNRKLKSGWPRRKWNYFVVHFQGALMP